MKVSNIETPHLTCRVIGHSWQITEIEVTKNNHNRKIYVEHLQCDRCGSTRRDAVLTSGVVQNRYYRYDNGYRIKGLGRDGISAVKIKGRIELIKRLNNQEHQIYRVLEG